MTTADGNHSEQLDGEALGEEPSSDGLPGIAGFPPERPLGVEDPAVLQGGSGTKDDLVTRDWRAAGPDVDGRGVRLDPGAENTPVGDTVADAVAESATPVDDPAAEEAAVHVSDPGATPA